MESHNNQVGESKTRIQSFDFQDKFLSSLCSLILQELELSSKNCLKIFLTKCGILLLIIKLINETIHSFIHSFRKHLLNLLCIGPQSWLGILLWIMQRMEAIRVSYKSRIFMQTISVSKARFIKSEISHFSGQKVHIQERMAWEMVEVASFKPDNS